MTRTEPAVLEPERVERMRATVMGAVEADRRARRRRARLALGGVAAAAVVVVGGVVGVGVLGERSAVLEQSDSGASSDTAAREVAPQDEGAGERTGVETETVVTTGSLSAEVDDVDEAVRVLRTFTTGHEGRIDAESLEQGSSPYADLTVRLPARHLDGLRDAVERAGDVRSMNVQREDVATQVADVEARMASLETSIRRLRAIIARADDTQDLLEAETQLTRRQADLESLQAQRRVLADRTSLATIQVSLYSDEAPRAVEPGGFAGGLTDGWNALVAAANAALAAVGFLVPWLLPLGALVAIGVLVRHRRRRR